MVDHEIRTGKQVIPWRMGKWRKTEMRGKPAEHVFMRRLSLPRAQSHKGSSDEEYKMCPPETSHWSEAGADYPQTPFSPWLRATPAPLPRDLAFYF